MQWVVLNWCPIQAVFLLWPMFPRIDSGSTDHHKAVTKDEWISNFIKDLKKIKYFAVGENMKGGLTDICHFQFQCKFSQYFSKTAVKRNDNILQVIIVSSSGWCAYNNPINVWNLSHSPESFPVTLQLPSHTPHHLFPISLLKSLQHYFRTLLNFCQLSKNMGGI